MCGILGVRRSFLDDLDRFQAGVDAMAWRGRDGSAVVTAGDWRLAVARLAITDPAHGQPLWSADRRRVIAFNGTVTSAAAERRQLATATATGNDAELPLRRLDAAGPEALLATHGHYALAILEPATDRLWLARDPEGEKPLFVVRRGSRLVAFASTLASLRRLGLRIDLPADEQARFVRFGFDLGLELYAPGLTLAGDLRGAVLHQGDVEPRAWTVPVVAPALVTDPPAAGPSLRDRVRHAAARCATASVPVGLSLSGGVDSACLAAALRVAGIALPAYQFRARAACGAERTRAAQVAAHTGMELRPVDAGPELLQDLPALTRCAGRPLGDPSVLAAHRLARAAAADGVRVLLGGEGADELFLGYRRHRAVHRLPRWRLPVGRFVSGIGMSTAARLGRAVASPAPYDALLEVAPPAFRAAVFAPEFAAGGLPADASGTRLDRARRVDREFYLRHDLLPKLDTALLAAGVEGRCPYLDPEVVASPEARAADPRQILGKRHLRAAFRADLPPGVLDGRKRGFALPLDRWLREDPFLPDLLRDVRTRQRSHLRADGLAQMLDAHRAGRRDLGHALYLIAALECHLRDVEDAA